MSKINGGFTLLVVLTTVAVVVVGFLMLTKNIIYQRVEQVSSESKRIDNNVQVANPSATQKPDCYIENYPTSDQFAATIENDKCKLSLDGVYELSFDKEWKVETSGAWKQNIILNEILIIAHPNPNNLGVDSFIQSHEKSRNDLENSASMGEVPYLGLLQIGDVTNAIISKTIDNIDVRVLSVTNKQNNSSQQIYVFKLDNGTIISLSPLVQENQSSFDETIVNIEELIPNFISFPNSST